MKAPRHGGRWLLALLVSLALHYGLLAMLARSPATSPSTSPTAGPGLMVQVLPAVAAAADAAAPALSPNAPATRAAPDPEPTRSPARLATSHSTRFYTLEEVDQPALPRLDWLLPLDRLAAAGLRRLVVQIWILETGAIADIAILSAGPAPLGPRDQDEIAAWLRRTELNPALKSGRPVASVRTLEMAFDL